MINIDMNNIMPIIIVFLCCYVGIKVSKLVLRIISGLISLLSLLYLFKNIL